MSTRIKVLLVAGLAASLTVPPRAAAFPRPKDDQGPLTVEKLQALLEKSEKSPEVSAIRDHFPGEATKQLHDDCYYLVWKEAGMSLRFENDRVVTVFLEKNYRGPLPGGLAFADTRGKARQKLGDPSKPRGKRGFYESWNLSHDIMLEIAFEPEHESNADDPIHGIAIISRRERKK